MGHREQNLRFLCLFFFYGGLINFLLFRWYVRLGYPPGSDRSFVDHPAVNVAAIVLPGISVAWFMFHLLRQAFQTNAASIVFKGGLYGILATVLALEVFYILCSLYLAFWAVAGEPISTKLWGTPVSILVSFIDIQTYGMEPVIKAIPFAFAYGVIGALLIRKVRTRGSQS